MKTQSVLSIAGSDPTGGAGLQADLQVFQALGVHGAAVPSALTLQNGLRVTRVLPVFPNVLLETLRSTLEAIRPAAIKIGMLATDDGVRSVLLALAGAADIPIVLDPVLAASDGTLLLERRAYPALRELMVGRTLITPNWPEAEILANRTLARRRDAEEAARDLLVELGLAGVLVKGGHRESDADDLLVHRTPAGIEVSWLAGERLPGPSVHGTGCALSSAITAHLARGESLPVAVEKARRFVRRALENAWTLENGARMLDFHA